MIMHNKQPKGFSLVELMIAVAILGVLASMAIPGYERYTLNAKQTERKVLLNNLVKDLRDLFDRNDGAYTINLPMSPSWPITYKKKPFIASSAQWNRVGFLTPGTPVLYHYQAWGAQTSTIAYFWAYAIGDIDADHSLSVHGQYWYRRNGQWTKGWETTDDLDW